MSDRPLASAKMIELPSRVDHRGALAFVESRRQAPFDIQRVYFMYDIAEHSERGAHAHKQLEQVIIAGHGSFDVVLDDGHDSRRFVLDDPKRGLYVPRMLWRVLENFSHAAFCLVLASQYYDEADYIRNYDEYVAGRT